MPSGKRPKVWHIYEFEQRFELKEDVRACRKGPLLYCKEAVSNSDDDAKDYVLQLTALRRYDNHLELHGAFVALRNQAADRSRAYRGYLLNGRREPARLVDITDWLCVPTPKARQILKRLETVGLLERIELPEFDLSKNEDPAKKTSKSESPEKSGKIRSPSRREGKGNGKGKGKQKEKTNGKAKLAEAEAQGETETKAKAQGPTPSQVATARAPATTPPSLPTEADARGASRSYQTERPPGSDMAAELQLIERRLQGLPAEPPPDESRYSDRAKLFASEIYVALGLNYGRRMEARELGCFASRWTDAEEAGLPPPVADRLWDHAVQAAGKLRKRRKLKKPGGMFCRVWTALLTKATASTL